MTMPEQYKQALWRAYEDLVAINNYSESLEEAQMMAYHASKLAYAVLEPGQILNSPPDNYDL